VLPIPIVLEVANQLCDGLEYAHSATDPRGIELKIIHRDLKPENILLSTHGGAKITDFGVAKATSNLLLTSIDVKVKGTIAYMSPEQAGCEVLDSRSDLYSLGAIIFEMLTLQRLYPDAQGVAGLFKVRKGELGDRFELLGEAPPPLVETLKRLLAFNRDERHGSAAEVRDELMAVSASLPPSAADLKRLIRETVGVAAPLSSLSTSKGSELGVGSGSHGSGGAPKPLMSEAERELQAALDQLPTTLAPNRNDHGEDLTAEDGPRKGNGQPVPSLQQLEETPSMFHSLHIALEDARSEPETVLSSGLADQEDPWLASGKISLAPVVGKAGGDVGPGQGAAVSGQPAGTPTGEGAPSPSDASPEGPTGESLMFSEGEPDLGPNVDSSTTPGTLLPNARPLEEGGPVFGGAARRGAPAFDLVHAEARRQEQQVAQADNRQEARASAGRSPPLARSRATLYWIGGSMLMATVLLLVVWQSLFTTEPVQLTGTIPRSASGGRGGAGIEATSRTGQGSVAGAEAPSRLPVGGGAGGVADPSRASEAPARGTGSSPGTTGVAASWSKPELSMAGSGENRQRGAEQADHGDGGNRGAGGAREAAGPSGGETTDTGTAQTSADGKTGTSTTSSPADRGRGASKTAASQTQSQNSSTTARSQARETSVASKPASTGSVKPSSTGSVKPSSTRAAKPSASKGAATQGAAGFITVNSKPFAYVYLDGKKLTKTTPLLRYPIPAGTHQLVFKTEDGRSFGPVPVEVKAGNTSLLRPIIFK